MFLHVAVIGVAVCSMHPGWTTTEGVKKSIPGFFKFYQDKFRDLEQGADTIVWQALQVGVWLALQVGGLDQSNIYSLLFN